MRLITILFLLVSSGAFGHSVEPGRVDVPATDGRVRFYLTAVNRFDHKALFVTEAFTDEKLTQRADVNIYPKKFFLGPQAKTSLFIAGANVRGDFLWVCTRTVDLTGQLQITTRVCSRARLRRR